MYEQHHEHRLRTVNIHTAAVLSIGQLTLVRSTLNLSGEFGVVLSEFNSDKCIIKIINVNCNRF